MRRLLIGVFGVAMLLGLVTRVSGADNPALGSWKIGHILNPLDGL
jgi:hypothetical protein